eukprot:761579-Hanusia_phi.AAC.4
MPSSLALVLPLLALFELAFSRHLAIGLASSFDPHPRSVTTFLSPHNFPCLSMCLPSLSLFFILDAFFTRFLLMPCCRFFMMLRRIGFRPFNKAPAPATSGMDYALRNKFVNEHGYIFDCETLEKYCQSRRVLTKLKRKMTAASGEGSVDTMESNSSRRKIMD